jgi:HPt (histidine-containing phosphotransfer) domain-containing protein
MTIEHGIDGIWQPTETLAQLAATGFADAVAELIGDFRTDTAARFERLCAALLRGDVAGARKEAHSIKGSALQMGADRVASLARSIETADAGGVTWRSVANLESALADAVRDMRAYAELLPLAQ